VKGLQDLVDIYIRPSSSQAYKGEPETIIPVNERKIVFGGVEGILQFHSQSFLPALEQAASATCDPATTPSEATSQRMALLVANVFRLYHPFMRQYSAYINNFDYALLRLRSWSNKGSSTASAQLTTASSHEAPSTLSAGAITAGLGIGAIPAKAITHTVAALTVTQKKRIASFLKVRLA
jgi:hypothetical protein